MNNLDSEEVSASNLFQDPDGYYQPEKPPSTISCTLPTKETLSLSLVGHNPLWGHHLFPASRVLAEYLYAHRERLCVGKKVLELGAGAGLPGLAASRYGADRVVISDYPDAELIANIQVNIDAAASSLREGRRGDGLVGEPIVEAAGYVWGRDLAVEPDGLRFDTLILSDLVFNHSQHTALAETITKYMARSQSSRALVFFTPHRPWLLDKDLAFVELLKKEETGLAVEKAMERKMDKVMFEDDRGDEETRKLVLGWEVRWNTI